MRATGAVRGIPDGSGDIPVGVTFRFRRILPRGADFKPPAHRHRPRHLEITAERYQPGLIAETQAIGIVHRTIGNCVSSNGSDVGIAACIALAFDGPPAKHVSSVRQPGRRSKFIAGVNIPDLAVVGVGLIKLRRTRHHCRTVNGVGGDRLAINGINDRKRTPVGHEINRLVLQERLIVVGPAVPVHADRDIILQLVCNAATELRVELTLPVGIEGRDIGHLAEIHVLRGTQFDVLRNIVFIGIGPRARVRRKRHRIERSNIPGCLRCVVSAKTKLHRSLAGAKQVIHGSESGRPRLPAAQSLDCVAIDLVKRAGTDKTPAIDRGCVNGGPFILPPQTAGDRKPFHVPGIGDKNTHVGRYTLANRNRSVVRGNRVGNTEPVILIEVRIHGLNTVILSPAVLNTHFEVMRPCDVRHSGRYIAPVRQIVGLYGRRITADRNGTHIDFRCSRIPLGREGNFLLTSLIKVTEMNNIRGKTRFNQHFGGLRPRPLSLCHIIKRGSAPPG